LLRVALNGSANVLPVTLTKLLNGKVIPWKDGLGVSVLRSLYLSTRFGGRIVILRGTRLRLDRGARILVPRGCRVVIGKHHAGGAPAALDMRRNARLTFHGRGRVSIARGTRMLILDDALVEIGAETVINFNATITCFKHIWIDHSAGISWNTNIFDGNGHDLVVDGVPRPPARPVRIGTGAWIGAGATVLGASVGAGAVVGAGSVVVKDVPEAVVVAGNPARLIGKNASWHAG
jgi:acetyltransferase-like isoleucine patch superfamily enzyme